MINQKQRKQYLKTQIQTASQEQLVLMLFDGAIRFCEIGKRAISENDIETVHINLTKAQEVVMELLYALDRDNGGDIAENLAKLYSYVLMGLVEANMKHDADKVTEVQKIIRELRDGWAQAMDNMKNEAAKVQQQNEVPQNPALTEPQPNTTDHIALESTSKAIAPTANKTKILKLPKTSPAAHIPPELRPRLSVQG